MFAFTALIVAKSVAFTCPPLHYCLEIIFLHVPFDDLGNHLPICFVCSLG